MVRDKTPYLVPSLIYMGVNPAFSYTLLNCVLNAVYLSFLCNGAWNNIEWFINDFFGKTVIDTSNDFHKYKDGFVNAAMWMAKYLIDNFGFYNGRYCLKGDIAVDIDSELGTGYVDGQYIEYKGFARKHKIFSKKDYSGDITHNQEVIDKELQQVIINDYKQRLERPKWDFSILDDGTASINFYNGIVNTNAEGKYTLDIPSQVTDGVSTYTVSSISDFAFKKDCYSPMAFGNLGSVECLTIPSTVKSIGASSFDGLADLKKVEFNSQSKLKTIGESSFANTAIEEISVPDSCELISENAFYKSSLSYFGPMNYYCEGIYNLTEMEINGKIYHIKKQKRRLKNGGSKE